MVDFHMTHANKAPCQHMLELEEWLIERGMHFGGCGECDSAWLKCAKCDVEIAGIAGMGMVAQND